MGLGYNSRIFVPLFGGTTTGVATTSAYADNVSSVIPIGGASKIVLYVSYTLASGETSNNINLRVDTSYTTALLYQLVNESVSGATSTLTQREFTFAGTTSVATSYNLTLPLDVSDNYFRVSFRESNFTGTNYGTATLFLLIEGDR